MLMLSYVWLALSDQHTVFYALATIVVGNTLFKANSSSLIAKMYRKGDPAFDGAMTMYYMAVNVGFQSYFGNAMTGGAKVTSKPYKYDPNNSRPLDVEVQKILDKGEGLNYFNKAPFPRKLEQVSRVLYNNSGDLVGAVGKSLLGQHTSIVLSDISSISGRIDLAHFPNMSHQYGLWGISHQAVNVSLLEAGYSSTVMSVGGGWTTGVSTVVYGPYGGGAVGATVASQELRK